MSFDQFCIRVTCDDAITIDSKIFDGRAQNRRLMIRIYCHTFFYYDEGCIEKKYNKKEILLS